MNQPAPSHAVAPPVATAELARRIALIQQIKDTITIVCMNLLLLVPIAWPGLLLYALRWRQTRRGARPSVVLWALTLLHEVLCLWLFTDIKPGSDMGGLEPFAFSYLVGTALAACGLITAFGLATAAPAGPSETTTQP